METPVEYNAGKTEKTQKKDRIYVFTDKFVCENCKDWYEHIDPLDNPDCTECAPADFPYITRQEAIEKMAKAICREDNCLDSCEECILGFGSTAEEKEQFCQKQIIMSRDLSASYVSRAEAALNALLEGK